AGIGGPVVRLHVSGEPVTCVEHPAGGHRGPSGPCCCLGIVETPSHRAGTLGALRSYRALGESDRIADLGEQLATESTGEGGTAEEQIGALARHATDLGLELSQIAGAVDRIPAPDELVQRS